MKMITFLLHLLISILAVIELELFVKTGRYESNFACIYELFKKNRFNLGRRHIVGCKAKFAFVPNREYKSNHHLSLPGNMSSLNCFKLFILHNY